MRCTERFALKPCDRRRRRARGPPAQAIRTSLRTSACVLPSFPPDCTSPGPTRIGVRGGFTLRAVPLRGLLFDFDGLLVDTETSSRASWEALYREHGLELPLDRWATLVGTVGGWDPWHELEELAGPLDREALGAQRREHELSLADVEELRPGVLEYLEVGRPARARDGDRLERRAVVDRPASRTPRAGGALRRDRDRRRRPRAGEAPADALPRGAVAARALRRSRRSRSRTRRTASVRPRRRGCSAWRCRTG